MYSQNGYGTPFQGQQSYFQPGNNYVMPMIYGRMVNSEADIFPNQIPNDGSAAYFPSTDGTKIYMRAWQKDGQVMRVSYSLDRQPQQSSQSVDQQPSNQAPTRDTQMDKLTALVSQLAQSVIAMSDKFDKLEKSLTE